MLVRRAHCGGVKNTIHSTISFVVEAVDQENVMSRLESTGPSTSNSSTRTCSPANDTSRYRKERKKLIELISRLNTVANFKRKGRDDLNEQILYDAETLIDDTTAKMKKLVLAKRKKQEVKATVVEHDSEIRKLQACQALAVDVVRSYLAFRSYLRDIATCLERLDPHLGC